MKFHSFGMIFAEKTCEGIRMIVHDETSDNSNNIMSAGYNETHKSYVIGVC